MKQKIIISILIITSIILIPGCSKKNEINNNTVVLYFSATGTTKKIAEKIANELNSDIIEIIPKEEYTKDDLNYNSDCRANREQKDNAARPEIKNTIDINKYDTIYLGYPIWWGTNPKIILTLLDTYDFTNKTIIPFCTSGSTGIDGSVNDLRNYNPNLTIKNGKRFSSSTTNQEIKDFTNNKTNEVIPSMKAIINEKEYIIDLETNETTKEFIKMLPQEFNMSELNGNEKYFYLDSTLPTNASNPKIINTGDIMLYGNNCLVVFYKTFTTSYSYTKIGHINNLPDLGKDNIKIKFEK